MRHLQLVVDHQPAPTDFPPTWHEFAAAKRRFLDGLAVPAPQPEAAPAASDDPRGEAPPP